MNLEQKRIKNPVMEFYRHVYKFSERWNGRKSLDGKKVIVYCEQGYGDIIQFLRYIKYLKEENCEVVLHTPAALHPILPYVEGVDSFVDKQSANIPEHDYHILSLSLPFLLNKMDVPRGSYINYDKTAELDGMEEDVNIGIAWEGSPEHPKNLDRCCPLKHFKCLLKEGVNLFMLQDKTYLPELSEDVNFDLYSIPIKDFGDTASLINAVDLVITVDTSIVHLAGAMGKRTFLLLSEDPDPRWEIPGWYDSVNLVKNGSWDELLKAVVTFSGIWH